MLQRMVSIDLETTGLDVSRHVPIQIGMYVPSTGARFTGLIGWREYEYDPRSMDVHGIGHISIRAAESAPMMDDATAAWLESQVHIYRESRLIPVGWNVGSFDMQFINKYLPRLASMFGHRAMDLNSILFDLALQKGWGDEEMSTFKTTLKYHAERQLAASGAYGNAAWHDAGYDAVAAWYTYEMIHQYEDDWDTPSITLDGRPHNGLEEAMDTTTETSAPHA